MKINYKLLIASFCLISSFVFSTSTFACHPGTFNDLQKAEAGVVFIGKPIAYQVVEKSNDKRRDPVKAKVTYEVTKTLKGENKKTWEFIISRNTDTGLPRNIKQLKKCYGAEAEVGLKTQSKESLPHLVQGPCHPGYIIPVNAPKPSLCRFN
jgi:hypothetical protein